MTKLKVRSYIFQIGCFGVLFFLIQYLLTEYTNLDGLWVSSTAFVVGTILSPVFQAVKTKNGERLFMKWIFLKGFKDIT